MATPDPIVLSIVVIGRNEGERLSKCLASLASISLSKEKVESIYVDTSSADDSLNRAEEAGAKVISIKSKSPSAALARNIGWRASRGEYVLFLDGDTVLQPNFVEEALPHFSDQTIAVVCGHRREMFPKASLYQRVLDLDWTYPTGFVDFCGGDALIRRDALENVGGFDSTLIAGEEPEMCRRLKSKGFRILRLDLLMTLHDLHIISFWQYWKRCFRTGFAYAEVSHRNPLEKDPLWRKESHYNLIKGALLLAFSLFAIALISFSLLPIITWLLILGILVGRSALKKGDLPYAVHAHFQHVPMFFGQLAYFIDHFLKRKRKLIEYK